MRQFLKERSRRHGYDGWGLRNRDTGTLLCNTVCTTRDEARAERDAQLKYGDHYRVVKVRITVEPLT